MEKNFYVIKARRWFERTNGNTYHSCEVIKNGQSIGRVSFTYGYGTRYEETALEILVKAKEIEKNQFSCLWHWKEFVGRENVYTDLHDVKRKKDL